jgi:hypothetical protein
MMCVLTKEFGDGGFVRLSLCNRKDHLSKRLVWNSRFNPIHHEKRKCGGCADAFVSIQKRMILDEAKEIGCGHFVQIAMKVVPAESGLWSGKCRVQESLIPDSERSTVPFNLVAMDFQHLVQREEKRLHSLFSEFSQCRTILPIYFG